MKRDYFSFYRSFYEQISIVPDELTRLAMYEVLTNYALNHEEPKEDMNTMVKIFWLGVKPLLDNTWKQYKNGSQGGAPLGNTNNKGKRKVDQSQPKVNPKLTQSQTIREDKDKDKDKDKESESESENYFHPPTLEEVNNYFQEKFPFNATGEDEASKFYAYYSARGWKCGTTPMASLTISLSFPI